MFRLWLIRHGQTEGNRYHRYIGRQTDEALCPEGIQELEKNRKDYPLTAQRLFVSPMLRARQTAQILFPGREVCVVEELSECDFGDFENKNYLELAGNADYQRWIDSGGMIPFPGGESREAFRVRTEKGFERIIQECLKDHTESAAIVLHGGNIMNLMESLCTEKRTYYDWHVKNGAGYEVLWSPDGGTHTSGTLKLCGNWP
ncbi:MAG: histidine phosphatase family protein [Blautia sp.]|nr:histidine phosphatase family protein [Blautia sp.]MDY5032016.1 histidine phosphatase family protein [Blautia sp.]